MILVSHLSLLIRQEKKSLILMAQRLQQDRIPTPFSGSKFFFYVKLHWTKRRSKRKKRQKMTKEGEHVPKKVIFSYKFLCALFSVTHEALIKL